MPNMGIELATLQLLARCSNQLSYVVAALIFNTKASEKSYFHADFCGCSSYIVDNTHMPVMRIHSYLHFTNSSQCSKVFNINSNLTSSTMLSNSCHYQFFLFKLLSKVQIFIPGSCKKEIIILGLHE